MIKTPARELTVLFLDGPFSGQYRTGCIGKHIKVTIRSPLGDRVWTYGRMRYFARDDATKPDMATATLLPSDLWRWSVAQRRPKAMPPISESGTAPQPDAISEA